MNHHIRWTAAILSFLISAAAVPAAAGAVQDAAGKPAVTLRNIGPFTYCSIAHKGPYADIGTVIGQLISAMQAQALFPQIRGTMIGVYYNSPADTKPAELSWEIGFIISDQAAPQAPLDKKTWKHTTVATALHVGPYEKLGETTAAIIAWLTAAGYEVDGPFLESYLDRDPMSVKPEKRRTEISIPCRKKDR